MSARAREGAELTLLRPRDGRMVGGVCSGIARRLGLDATLVRVAWVVLGLLGIGIPLYLILWLALPQEDAT